MTCLFNMAAGMGLPSVRYARFGQSHTGDLQKRRYTTTVTIGLNRSLPRLCFTTTSPRPSVMLLLIDFSAGVIQSLLRPIPFFRRESATIDSVSELSVLNPSLLSGQLSGLPACQ